MNLLIEIKPVEADALIQLIEYLFRQWYIRRHEDEENLSTIKVIASDKKNQKWWSKE